MRPTCSLLGCDRRHNARGLCTTHYMRALRAGEIRPLDRSPEARFWAKVQKTDTCWLWMACTGADGYGKFFLGGKRHRSHRVAYVTLVGPIPEGMQLDHLCRVRSCVNPDHLEPVTSAENTRRGLAGALNAEKSECPRGHEYSPENTYAYRGRRNCRTCAHDRGMKFREQRLSPREVGGGAA